ncbi:MAG: starch-binding protein [Ruminococcus sp.]|nr:starch-binding protein [Ruminococcus sp.]
MKNSTKRLFALVLILTLIVSTLAPIYTNAEESEYSEDLQFSGNQSFVKINDKNGTSFYGVTGNNEIGSEPPAEITTIDSVEDYYSIINKADNSKKSIASTSASALPSFIDNSNSIYFPAIGNQGSLGSCTCWAQVYYQFTYMMNKDRGVATTPENTFSPQWAYNVVAGINATIGPYYSTYSFMKNQGNVFMSQVPYTLDTSSISPTEDVWKTSIKYRIEDFHKYQDVGGKDKEITSYDDEDLLPIKTALSNGEVLAYSTHINSWKVTKIKTNPSAPENNKYANEEATWAQIGKDGGHRMTIVGYNDNLWIDINNNDTIDAGETGAFKIANSWGDGYANKGFMWVAYDALNKESCVEGVEPNSAREAIFTEISGISVVKEGTNSDIYIKYTVNTSDRSQVSVSLSAEKDGTIYNRNAYSNEYSGTGMAYDGSKEATDATMILLINNIADGITSENFSDYSFSVNFEDKTKDSTVLTVKNAEIIDETANKVYKVPSTYSFTLDGETKSIKITESSLNHAVVYYRGYKTPKMNYKLGNGNFVSEDEFELEENIERRGYTHKYVIDLKNSDSATLYFTDGNNAVDDNNSKYFTAKKGLNYYVTENVGEPLTASLEDVFGGVADVDYCSGFTATAQGGYTPYTYKYTITDLATNEITDSNPTDKNTFANYFRKEGTYKVTVDVTDYADKTVSSSVIVDIVDIPFEFEKFTMDDKTIFVGNETTFTALTKNEKIKYIGRPSNTYTFEVKDENGKVCFSNTKQCNTYNLSYRFTETLFPYTPSKAGKYTITVSSTDGNKEYAEKTLPFTVYDMIYGDADGNTDVNIMDATTIQQYLANIITKEQIFTKMADCDDNSDVNIMDATRIQLYLAKKENSGSVGNVIEYIPPTEPETEAPTTAPTQKPTEAPKSSKVTFTNSLNWSGTIYCYYWSDENTAMTSWPGQSMTNAGTNEFSQTLYTFDVPQGATNLIFTNGSSQTVDIKYSGGEVRYYALNTKTGNGYNIETW